jgi:hypothetical protein
VGEVEALIRKVTSELETRFGPTDLVGRHRRVFESKFNVIKCPKNMAGIDANYDELRWYKQYLKMSPKRRWAKLARCRLIHIQDIPILVMEKLCFDNIPHGKLPEWTMSIDGGQVAFNKQKELVAYDYA